MTFICITLNVYAIWRKCYLFKNSCKAISDIWYISRIIELTANGSEIPFRLKTQTKRIKHVISSQKLSFFDYLDFAQLGIAR